MPASRRLGAWLRGEEVSVAEARADGIYEVPANDNGFGNAVALPPARSAIAIR